MIFGESVLGKLAMTFLMAMVPVVELRGAIPLGVAAGLPPAVAAVTAMAGNLTPVPCILLLLRRLSIDDSEMMFNNWASDPEVTKYLRWNAHRSWAETAEMLNEWEKHYGDPTFYQWGVENKRSGVLMGTISLFPAPELKTGWHLNTEILGSAWEAGYALGRKWWNNGYMTEALCAVRDYWFNTVDAPWLVAIHANENVASSAVLQKAGFVYDHDVIDHKFDGTAVPCRAYHLVKEDL